MEAFLYQSQPDHKNFEVGVVEEDASVEEADTEDGDLVERRQPARRGRGVRREEVGDGCRDRASALVGVAGGEDEGGEAGEDGGEAGPVALSPSPSTVKRIFRRRSSERWKMEVIGEQRRQLLYDLCHFNLCMHC